MLNQVRLLAFCLLTVALGTGGLIQQQLSRAARLTESETTTSSTVELAVGDTLALVLDVNPSTSHASEIGVVCAAIKPSAGESKYTEADRASRVGGADQYTFCFLDVGEGQVELKLIIAARLSQASRP
jgi:hypothetical protein